MERAIETAKAIQSLLGEYGIENESLEAFVKEAETLPSGETVDTYNRLVEEYKNATSRSDVHATGEALLAHYHKHEDQLLNKADEMRELAQYLEDDATLEELYIELARQLDY